MANKVKRFIGFLYPLIGLLLFLGISSSPVKSADEQILRDQVVTIQHPFQLTLKKNGPIRLSSILYDADSRALADFVAPDDKIKLRFLSPQPDRYGRKAAQVYLKDGRWLQGELVRRHFATPYPYPGETRLIRDLYQIETPKAYNALTDTIALEQFAIVDGMVVDVAAVKKTVYLNFGGNWRTDFTVKIDKKAQKRFLSTGIDLFELKGREIRIRGWVFKQNGPMIKAEDPNQLQILSP